MFKKFSIRTDRRNQMIDISSKIREAINQSGVTEGVAFIHIPHTTAGVTINENADPDVQYDMEHFMSKLIPKENGFHHFEGNSDSHIKASLFGCDKSIIIEDGEPLLGTWQGVYFCEFDGPRNRNFYVKIM